MNNKSLQKFTDLEKLLSQKKITPDNIINADKNLLAELTEYLNDVLNNGTGEKKDEVLAKADSIIPKDYKNEIWQHNHVNIIHSINKLIQVHNRLPTITDISEHVNLSRQTVTKHLKEFSTKEIFQTEIDKYHIMLYSLMDKLYIDGVQNKNVKAIRMYFEILTYKTKHLSQTPTNNYIQINNTKIDNLTIQNLSDSAKNEIMSIINKNVNTE